MNTIPDEIIVGFIPLAKKIALQTWLTAPQALNLDEIMSIAFEGLCRTVDRYPAYCEENGFEINYEEGLCAYIKKRVHGAIIDSFRAKDIASRKERANYRILVGAGLLDGVTEKELIELTNISSKDIRLAVKYSRLFVESLDAEIPSTSYSGDQASRYQAKDATNVAREVRESALCDVVVSTIAKLPKLQQVILALHYVEGLEFRFIAETIGIQEARASREHTDAVLKVREALVDALVDDFTS